jgi:hypothetical protein
MLRDKLGDRFLGGIVLYLGERSYTTRTAARRPPDQLWLNGRG